MPKTKLILALSTTLTLVLMATIPAKAANITTKHFKGKIVDVFETSNVEINNQTLYQQRLNIEILEGEDQGKYVTVNFGEVTPIKESELLKMDDLIVIEKVVDPSGNVIHNIDQKYRIDKIIYIVGIFLLLAIIFAGLKGIMAILGLIFSYIIIVTFILPNILAGQNPIVISLFGSFLIALFSIYLAHGINIKTTIALTSTLITLCLTTLLSFMMVYLTDLTGAGSEEALFLQFGYNSNLNLQGLLLGGIIIGTLGVLDDITTSQVAAINEIHHANSSLKFWELYKRGTNIGKEHIASLINTLVLAYTGASLPLILLFTLNKDIPLWVTLNSEFIVEEIVRTLVGSSGLILAVPISTILAAYVFGVRKFKAKSNNQHYH